MVSLLREKGMILESTLVKAVHVCIWPDGRIGQMKNNGGILLYQLGELIAPSVLFNIPHPVVEKALDTPKKHRQSCSLLIS